MTTKAIPNILSCDQLAEHIGLPSKRLRLMCATGQIPYSRKLGRAWVVLRRGVEWLQAALDKYAERFRDNDPTLPELLRAVAVKLDAELAERIEPDKPSGRRPLPDTIVKRIRKQAKGGKSLAQISAGLPEEYRRNKSAISRIVAGDRYSTVA